MARGLAHHLNETLGSISLFVSFVSKGTCLRRVPNVRYGRFLAASSCVRRDSIEFYDEYIRARIIPSRNSTQLIVPARGEGKEPSID